MWYATSMSHSTEIQVERDRTSEHLPERDAQAQWELAECTCPDPCERDHELD